VILWVLKNQSAKIVLKSLNCLTYPSGFIGEMSQRFPLALLLCPLYSFIIMYCHFGIGTVFRHVSGCLSFFLSVFICHHSVHSLAVVVAALSRQVHKEISIKMQQCRTPSSWRRAKLTNRDTFPRLESWYSSLVLLLELLLVLLSVGRPLEFGSHESRTSRQWLANDFSLLQVFGQTAKGGFGQCFWKLP